MHRSGGLPAVDPRPKADDPSGAQKRYIEAGATADVIIGDGLDEDVVRQVVVMVDATEYK